MGDDQENVHAGIGLRPQWLWHGGYEEKRKGRRSEGSTA
jgi:hypothetical protein